MPRPARPWFRFYSEAVENLKVHNLPDRLFKSWVFLMCLANINEPRGRLPSFAKIGFALRLKEDRVKGLIAELIDRGFVDQENHHYVLHEWDDWQQESDAGLSPGRANYADARRNGGASAADAPRMRRESAADAPRMRRIDKRREETEKEQEQETDAQARNKSLLLFAQHAWGRLLTPLEVERLYEMAEIDYSEECVKHAVEISTEANKRDLRYVDGICRKHKEQGDCYAGKPERGQLAESRGMAAGTKSIHDLYDRTGVDRSPLLD